MTERTAKILVTILTVLLIASVAVNLYFFYKAPVQKQSEAKPDNELKSENAVKTENKVSEKAMPDLIIEDVRRLSASQWRVNIANIGNSCTKKNTLLQVTPIYIKATKESKDFKTDAVKTNEVISICQNNRLFFVISFAHQLEKEKDFLIYNIKAVIDPAPSQIEESNEENNQRYAFPNLAPKS